MHRAICAFGMGVLLLGVAPCRAAEDAKAEPKADEKTTAEELLKGVYVGLGPMYSIAAFDFPATTTGTQNSWGLDARVGYRLHPHLGLEVNYQWAARYEITSGGMQLNTVETSTVTGNARIFIFDGPIAPYATLGIGFMNADFARPGDRTEGAFRGGGGVQFFFTEHLGAYFDVTYLAPFRSLSDYAAVPFVLGAAYKF